MIERRRHQRNDLMAGVQYARSSDTSDNVSRGVIRNYSYSGICMIASQPFAEGQEIVVNNLTVPSLKKAIVRWQQKISNDSYNIGLEYVRSPIVDPGLHSQGTPIDNNSVLARFIRFIFGITIGGLLITVLIWISAQLGYDIPLVAVGLFLLFIGISFAVWGDKFFKVLKYF